MAVLKPNHSLKLFLIFAIFQSCTSASRVQRAAFYRANPQSLFDAAQQHSRKLHTFEGSGHLTVESPDGGFNGTARVYYQQPDSLLIQIKTGPGVSVGYLLVIGRKFSLYNIPDNIVYRSEGDQVPLEQLIGIRLQLPNIFDAALGVPRLQAAHLSNGGNGDSLRFEAENDKIRYFLEHGGDRYGYLADPKEGAFVGYTLVRSGETDSVYCVYKQFQKHKGIKIPRHIQITRPAQKERISFFYTRLKINGKLPKHRFKLKVSSSAEVINLDEESP